MGRDGFDPPRRVPGSNPRAVKAPDGRPDDTPKQVGFGIRIHRRKAVGFLGLAPKAESVG